jgi:hypothetical protein
VHANLVFLELITLKMQGDECNLWLLAGNEAKVHRNFILSQYDDLGTVWTTGIRFPAWAGKFSLRHRAQTGCEAHLAPYPMGTGTFSPGVKRPGREADHLPPLSAEVKNKWSYNSTSPYVFTVGCLVKHRIRGCTQKFPDWVDNEIYAYNNKHSFRSNTKGYGGKTHQTDS